MSVATDYQRVLLTHPGRTTPVSLTEYRQEDGYVGWEKALKTMTPDQVVEEVNASGLRGRGGGRHLQRPRADGYRAAPRARRRGAVRVCDRPRDGVHLDPRRVCRAGRS